MNTNDIINILNQLDNRNLQSSVLPWQMQEINQAQLLPNNTLPSNDDIRHYARALAQLKNDGDIDKAEYFCFVPASNKKWKVFLLDRFNRLIAQLEDYEGRIMEITQNQRTPCKKAFLLKI